MIPAAPAPMMPIFLGSLVNQCLFGWLFMSLYNFGRFSYGTYFLFGPGFGLGHRMIDIGKATPAPSALTVDPTILK